MLANGHFQTAVNFVVPLGNGGTGAPPEQTMVRSQFEDLRVFLHRVDGKVPDALADLIDLKAVDGSFTCGSCYAVGEHRDTCKFDCPQAQEQAIWALGRQSE